MSQAASTTNSAPEASSPSSVVPPPKPKTKASKRKPKTRRGARVEEDEEEDEETAKASVGDEPTSDSDSDEQSQDEDDSDDESASDTESIAAKPIDATSSHPNEDDRLGPPDSNAVSASPALRSGAAHPSWADVPTTAEEDLPTLDFASLTPSTLEQVPMSRGASNQNPTSSSISTSNNATTAPLSRKAQLIAKRVAKQAELKASDPAAYEAQEQERKAREQAKKREKRERKKLEKLGQVADETQAPVTPLVSSDGVPSAQATTTLTDARSTRGPVPSKPSRTAQIGAIHSSSSPSTTAQSTSGPQPPRTEPFRRGPMNGGVFPPRPDYVSAREAYSNRLAADPSYTPRVGRFWSHDDRLAPPEIRPLMAGWGRGGRGRGGGDGFRGRGGRGAFRGGREGAPPPESAQPGWDISAGEGVNQTDATEVSNGEGQGSEVAAKKVDTRSKEVKEEVDDDDDGWGRGEAKRKLRPSIPAGAPAAIPAWSHDGFAELVEAEATRPPRGAGGARGRGGRITGPPGSINPAYANLPFHPKHRFPPAPAPRAAPPPEEQTTTSVPTVEQDVLFETSNGPESVVRLPGSSVATLANQISALTLDSTVETPSTGVIVKLGGGGGGAQQPVTVFPRSAEETEAEQEERRRGGASILYAADPERLQRAQDPAAVVQYQPVHQQMQPQYYQLPPHLQPQPQQQVQFLPRHGSPAFYPQQYYSPEGFANMPTPGATPPPVFPGQAAAFFAPPRPSRIEIKAPGPSHSPSGSQKPAALSAAGDAFQPRQQGHNPYAHAHAPSFESQGSPASSPSPHLAPQYGYYQHPLPQDQGGYVSYDHSGAQQQYYDPYTGYPQDPGMYQQGYPAQYGQPQQGYYQMEGGQWQGQGHEGY
ncbi:hypothetical protein P7C70_g2004, partial [Phenoliferia sp. Uapishka_3]